VNPELVGTGAALLAVNAYGSMRGVGGRVGPGDTSVWNPRTGGWVKVARAPSALAWQTPQLFWTGREVLAMASDGRLLSFRPG
jgi:hypothetical protein